MEKSTIPSDLISSFQHPNSTMGKRSLEEAQSAKESGKILEDVVSRDEASMDEDEEAEQDEEDGEEPKKDAIQIHGRPTKKQRKQLTAQEVQIARETAELFKSNIFKLQIDELVSEIKIKEAHIGKIEKVLHRLHDCILMVPDTEELTLAEAEKRVSSKKVAIPFPEPKPTKANYTFAYLAPEDVSLVGSFGLKTSISQTNGLSIDISLTMPKDLFHHKDYLNNRALYKRSFYLAYLAENLTTITKKNGLPVKISWAYLNEDVLCPVLQLESIKTDNDEDLSFYKTKFTINLLAAFPFGIFDAKKLLPDKNCIRVQSEESQLPPTPYYNSSVLSISTYDYYLKFLFANKKAASSFKDACTLGRLWLQQRGLGSSISKGGFGHFEFAILLGALLSGGGISGNKILLHGFSSYQLFKGAVKYLASMDLTTGYLSFTSQIGEGASAKYIPDAGFNTPTIFDKIVKLNLLWKMTRSSYQELRLNAISTLALLNDNVFDRFDSILLQKVTLEFLKYDLLYEIQVPDEVQNSFGPLEKITFITNENYVKHRLHSILNMALGDRVTCLLISSQKSPCSFSLVKRRPASPVSNIYTIGIQLNPEESEKLVTKGPSDTEDEKVAKFRSFWGQKSSLRKFKDGTIQHCVVWAIERNEPLVTQIIKYILELHLNPFKSTDLTSYAEAFNARSPTPALTPPGLNSIVSTANFAMVRTSFDNLSRVLSLIELPLSIKSVMPASASLRGTSILKPVPFAAGNPDFWNDVVLQFETSSRWPDEIIAIEKTKTAFLLKISDLLNKEDGYRAFILKDTSIPFNYAISLLNVLTPEGFGFRVRVLAEKDEKLYLRAVSNSDAHKSVAQNVYYKFYQKYMGSVKHTRTIGILSSSYVYYSPTVRLFKQWLDAHTFLTHLTDELVELIALKPFVDPAPFSVPNSVCKGFLQILNFLASWNWKDEPLILDLVKRSDSELDEIDTKLSEKLSVLAYQVIQSNFEKIRKNDPSAFKTQFFVGSRDDPSGILWSNTLTLPIASRLTALARAAMQVCREQGISENTLDLLFTPALSDFDFVIKLKGSDNTKACGIAKDTGFKNLSNTNTVFPTDVTSKTDLQQELLTMLDHSFGEAVIFSMRKCPVIVGSGENIICGVFVPSALSKKKFRVSLGIDVKPTGEAEEVVVDKQDMMNQIQLLGGDMIKSIESRK